MKELRQDLRVHPWATLLLLACWGASTWLVAVIGMNALSLYVLLLPPLVAGYLFGWARRVRAAQSPGVIAALVVALVLIYVSFGGLTLAGRGGVSETPPPGPFGPLILRVFTAAIVAPYGLVTGTVGWFFGWQPWRSRQSSSPTPRTDAGARSQDGATEPVG